MIAQLRMACDPVELFRHAIGEPDPWQVAVLRSTAPQVILNTSRQAGKSSVLAAKVAHRLLFRPPARVAIVGPSLFQALLSFGEVSRTIVRVARPSVYERETRVVLELRNGSKCWALPGTERTVRGLAALDVLVVDEAGRIDDALIAGVRPMLAVKAGTLILASTPWARAGTFYETWTQGGDDWERHTVPAPLVPRLSTEFLERERRALGDRAYNREYMCQFATLEGGVFDAEQMELLINPSIEPLFPELVDVDRVRDGESHSHIVVPLEIPI